MDQWYILRFVYIWKNASEQPVRNSPNSSVMEPVSKPPFNNLSSSFDPVVILKFELGLSQIAEDQESIRKVYRTWIIWDLFRCISVAVVNPVGTYTTCNYVQGTVFFFRHELKTHQLHCLQLDFVSLLFAHTLQNCKLKVVLKVMNQLSIPWSP